MRLIFGLITLISLVTLMIVAIQGDATVSNTDENEIGDRFVVHEWGTFTSFSGSDGVKLEFRPLVDADLPPFVLDRQRQAGTIDSLFLKSNTPVRQRIETPVTYFYADRLRQANVSVRFPEGLLTEFFPPVEQMQPEFKRRNSEPLTDSVLDWGKVWIVPENRLPVNVEDTAQTQQLRARIIQKLLPATSRHDHYAHARETDSALVYVERQADKKRPFAPSGAFFEKFLFYRGIGNFDLPLQLTARSDGRYELSNHGTDPIRSLFLVTVEGEQMRFVKYDEIPAGGRLTMVQSKESSSVDELAETVVQALVRENLYEKEARAMVKTWQSSWFGEQGSRLFYVLPQSITETLLPLTIEPQPDENVRVMVGRLEIMSPEQEARVTALVHQSVQDRAAAAKSAAKHPDAKPQPYDMPKTILDLGRLAEPALVRVQNISEDASVRHEAAMLLRQLQQQ